MFHLKKKENILTSQKQSVESNKKIKPREKKTTRKSEKTFRLAFMVNHMLVENDRKSLTKF